MSKVPAPQVVTAAEAAEMPLPAQIQEALGELVGAAREGLLALSVGVGLGVVHELMDRRLDDVRLAVMMLDGLEIAERCHVVALGITTEGVKIPLGLWEGSTENATLARTLLADLADRGLDSEQAILFVIDGGKALRRAIRDVFGEHALVHRCQRHKERNVCHSLPGPTRSMAQGRDRGAATLTDA